MHGRLIAALWALAYAGARPRQSEEQAILDTITLRCPERRRMVYFR